MAERRRRPLETGEARADIRAGRLLPVQRHLQDSHYPGPKRIGHGEGYRYGHDAEGAVPAQDYLGGERGHCHPTDRGFEKKLTERLEEIRQQLRRQRRWAPGKPAKRSGQHVDKSAIQARSD